MQTLKLKNKLVRPKKPEANQVQSYSAFTQKLQDCGSDREKLVILMAEIDAEKRSLKSRLCETT